MLKIKNHIPNFLTILNLLSGTLGIIALLLGYGYYACIFVWIGLFFDFFDGFIARLLSVTSALGKQLDTLADLITFGLLPTLIMFGIIYDTMQQLPYMANYALHFSAVSLLILVCSAIRLAHFNIKGNNHYFEGLPTPANALLISTLHILLTSQSKFYQYLDQYFVHTALPILIMLLSITLMCSYLLISQFRFFNFKFVNLSWHNNKVQYIYLLGANIWIFLFQIEGISLLIIWYILLSILIYHRSTKL